LLSQAGRYLAIAGNPRGHFSGNAVLKEGKKKTLPHYMAASTPGGNTKREFGDKCEKTRAGVLSERGERRSDRDAAKKFHFSHAAKCIRPIEVFQGGKIRQGSRLGGWRR